jgi:hypothetical protein
MGNLAPPPCATTRAAPLHPAGAPLRRADSCLQALGNLRYPPRLAHRVHMQTYHPILEHRWPLPLALRHDLICKVDRLALPFFCCVDSRRGGDGSAQRPPCLCVATLHVGAAARAGKKAAHRESRWKGVGVARCAGLLLAVIRSVRLRLFGARAEASAGEETEAPSVRGPQPKWRRFRLIPSQRPPPR